MVATETEAVPAESTGPTVNIQTTEAAKAEPVHNTAAELELTVKTMSAEPAEGKLDWAVVSQEDRNGNHLGDQPVSCEKSGIPDSALSVEQVQQCASVELVAEMQPVATTLGLDENLSDSCHVPESAVRSLAAEKEFVEVIDVEGEDALMMEEEAQMSKDKNYDFRFTVAPAYIRDCEKEEHSEEEAIELTLDEELADVKNAGERQHTEVDGKRVQFSSEVQYFEGDKIPTELEDGIEEVDEEEDECSPTRNSPDIPKYLPFEKEKYYYVQMDGSEDEMERIEKEETDGKKEEGEEEYDEEEIKLKKAEDCVDEKVREDIKESEEEKDQTEVLKKEEPDQKSSPHQVTLTEPLTSDAPLTHSPPAVSQLEVTLHQLQWPQPGPCNLTSTLPFCQHSLPLIIKGKTRTKAWTCVLTC